MSKNKGLGLVSALAVGAGVAAVAAGKKYGEFHGEDRYTTKESERLLRLPLHYNVSEEDVHYVCKQIKEFYKRG